MNYSLLTNEHGTFRLIRSESPNFLTCDRCMLPKETKVTIEWFELATDRQKTICAACYGQLRALPGSDPEGA